MKKFNNLKTTKKAFTLVELLVVIAIIGILFVVLVSKVDFATDKAKATGVQVTFRSYQMAFEHAAKGSSGFNINGWNTGDISDDSLWQGKQVSGQANGVTYTYTNKDKDAGDGVRNTYDRGDANLNGKEDAGEVFCGRKFPVETWTDVYTLTNPADPTSLDGYRRLERAINSNLDPSLHITIGDPDANGVALITMANAMVDPWGTEYKGYYISNAHNDDMDRGAIVLYSAGPNGVFGCEQSIANGVVTVSIPGNNVAGQDDYSLVVCCSLANDFVEIKTSTGGFSTNQGYQSGAVQGSIGTENNGEENNGEINTPVTTPTYDPIELLSDEFKMVDGSGMNFTISEDAITLYMNGEFVGEIPSMCFTIDGNNVYVSGTGQYDGTFTICEDGYVELNGDIIAKAKKAWVSVAPGEYLIVHNNAVYNSQDGNSIEYKYGNVDELVYYLEAFKQTPAASLFALSGYNVSSYNGTLTVENCFDVLTIMELGENPRFPYGYDYEGLYVYYGGSAIDSKTTNSKIKTAFWQANDVKMEQVTKIYRVGNGKSLLTLNDELAEGLYLVDRKETYYHDDQVTENIMFFEDYALYFEDGMTYRQWMHGTFGNTMVLNDTANTAEYDFYGVYIAEEYLDTLCEAGYDNKIQGGTRKEHHSQLGFWCNGTFCWEYVYYSYGKATIFHVDMNKAGYQDLGSAWAGGVQSDNTIYMEDFYNYFSKYGTNNVLGRGFAAAFKPATNNVVDISSFVSVQNGQLIIDTAALQSVYGVSGDVEYIPIINGDGYYIDCSSIELEYSDGNPQYIRVTYTLGKDTTLNYDVISNHNADLSATGITFYYNGVVYTGFAR